MSALDNRTAPADKASPSLCRYQGRPGNGPEEHVVNEKRLAQIDIVPVTLDPDLVVLRIQLPKRLLRSVRIQAALDGKSLDDFISEVIEEQLRR